MENQTEENKKAETEDTKNFESAEAIAKDLYTVYCEAVGGRAFNNDPLPTWDEFRADPAKQKQSDAWVQVAIRAYNRFASAGRN